MSELLVTQCPHCQTRFRLTPEQVSVAAGRVRCGACLEVFQAKDSAAHLASAPPVTPSTAPAPPGSAARQQLPHTASPDPSAPDSLLQDALDEPDLAALGLDASIIDEVNPGAAVSGQADTPDEVPSPSRTGLADLHEDFLATPPARDFGPDFDHRRTSPYRPLAADESYTDRGIFQRDHPDAAGHIDVPRSVEPPTAPTDLPQDSRRQIPASAVPPDTSSAEAARAQPDFEQPQPDTTSEADGYGRAEPPLTLLGLELLEEELLASPAPRRRTPSWLWTSLALLALLALPAQYLYYNFDALARDQRSRPLLENLCLLASCKLPARVDISRIRSTNLLVRPHPEFPNALAIDVILYNRAEFEQPFPVLEMQFADSSGRQLASRRFRPEEYLSGELAGVELMPPQTPIHVALSMLDPGHQARSYRLEFHSP